MTMAYLGIDPGKDGQIVLLRPEAGIASWPTPTIKVGKKRAYYVSEMVAILNMVRKSVQDNNEVLLAVIEEQQAMPKQGVVSTFSTGEGFGLWKGILAALEIPFLVVRAAAWKKVMLEGTPPGETKARSVIAAQRLFPKVSLMRTLRCKKANHHLAEALLLARYGWIRYRTVCPTPEAGSK